MAIAGIIYRCVSRPGVSFGICVLWVVLGAVELAALVGARLACRSISTAPRAEKWLCTGTAIGMMVYFVGLPLLIYVNNVCVFVLA
jgi:hypothetical protein